MKPTTTQLSLPLPNTAEVSDKTSIPFQNSQANKFCTAKFSGLICRPIATQFINNALLAMFEFEQTERGIRVSAEKHYRLVSPHELTEEELASYHRRTV
jgi:hypothetical protein